MNLKTRTPAVGLDAIPGSLPLDTLPEEPDLKGPADTVAKYLKSPSSSLLAKDALWRDALVLTDMLRTISGPSQIADAWQELLAQRELQDVQIGPTAVQRLAPGTAWIDVSFTFSTSGHLTRTGAGAASVVTDDAGNWRIWMLRTWLEAFDGHGNPDLLAPSQKVSTNGHTNGAGTHVSTVIVGAGPSGLSNAGRLQALGLSYILLERNAQIGDNWLTKYDSVKLHTPREYANLPFGRTFKPDDPELLSARDLADGYQGYTAKHDINIWLSAFVEGAFWDDNTKTWTVHVKRDHKPETITCQHLVLTIGSIVAGPVSPNWPRRDAYQGDVVHALGEYDSAAPWKGKRGIIIGSANSAHDIAQDMLDAGLSSVTMIQRSPTLIVRLEWVMMLMGRKIPPLPPPADRMIANSKQLCTTPPSTPISPIVSAPPGH